MFRVSCPGEVRRCKLLIRNAETEFRAVICWGCGWMLETQFVIKVDNNFSSKLGCHGNCSLLTPVGPSRENEYILVTRRIPRCASVSGSLVEAVIARADEANASFEE